MRTSGTADPAAPLTLEDLTGWTAGRLKHELRARYGGGS
jgi:hypothetical protein